MEEMLHPFDDYPMESLYVPFGQDSASDSSSSPSMTGDPNSLFPQMLQSEDYQDEAEDSRSIFNQDQLSESTNLSPDLSSPSSQSSMQYMSSPVSSNESSEPMYLQEPYVKQEVVQEPEIYSTGFVDASVVQVPDRKKRRRSVEPKQQQQKTVGKKRKARAEGNVVMDFENLAGMSSAELDSLLEALSAEGTLKVEDEKLLKKAKRKIKNRESAQISRIRHRDHMQLVEAELEHEKKVNAHLRQYVDMVKGVMKQHGLEVPPEPEIPPFVPPVPSELSVAEPSRTVVRPLRIAGICLMMFVLSVGIVYNVMHHMVPTNGASDTKNSLVPVAAPAAEPSARVMVDSSSHMAQMSHASTRSSDPARPPDSVDVIRRSAYLSYDTDKADSSLALVIPSANKQDSSTSSSNALVPRSVMTYTTKAIFGNSKPRLADRSWTLDNTSYILINDASEFVPRSVDLGRVQARTEPVIGLLIPASSFNIPNLAPDDVVELVCGIRNATVVPRSVLSRSLY